MKCAYSMRGGAAIGVDGLNVTLINIIFKEQCTMHDILAIRLWVPSISHRGSIEIITNKVMERQRIAKSKKPVPYAFTFKTQQFPVFEQFFREFLSELRRYKGSEGTLSDDNWWTWPEDESASSAEQNNVLAEAVPADAPAPAAPTEPAAAPVEAAVERAIQSVETEEKRQKGPACPDCGCTSIFADKDDGGVIITCLNCGRQWRPGQHRSW